MRTASQIACTAGTAASTSKSARGTTVAVVERALVGAAQVDAADHGPDSTTGRSGEPCADPTWRSACARDRLDYGGPRERHPADVPAERGAVPRGQRAADGLRGPLPRAGPPPAARRGPRRARLRLGRHPRGLRGRRPRRPVAVPGRLPGAADRGREPPRRHVQHRRRSAWTASSWSASTPPGRSRSGTSRRAPRPPRRSPRTLLERARATFTAYRAALAEIRADPYEGDLPRDPTYLSWTLAACAPLPLPERQALLEAEDTGDRLRLVTDLLRSRAARDERDPLAAGHRGGPHPLVAQLSRPVARSPTVAPAVRRPRVALAAAGVAFALHAYDHDPRPTSYGAEAAEALGRRPDRVFKTLLADGRRRARRGRRAGRAASSTSRPWPAPSAAPAAAMAERRRAPSAPRATSSAGSRRSASAGPTRPWSTPRPWSTTRCFVSAGRRGLDVELAAADLVRLTGAITDRIGR